ncbi:hypothetical protein MNV49_005842 [Pseudohyphozyma bogoriensis]|nr:hypothetical protein MNV49_005842 [Pseudohyphozyma bogoriensis]
MLSWFSLLTTASVAVVAVRAQTPSCPALTNPYIGDYDGTAFNLCCEVSQTPVNNDGASSCAVTAYDAATNAVTYACAYTSTASTGADFVFPSGVASLGLTVSGQPGGSSATSGYGSRQGGSGATLAGSLTTADYAFTGTTAGTFTGTVYVNVGGGLTESEGFESGGGYSSFGYSSTGTSGATLAPGTAADPRIVTAGGGGGVSETPGGDGGSAGPAGGSGIDGESTNTPPNGGLGGSQTAPGTGQGGFAAGVSGSGPSGGAGRYGGGGGGGYFGGAGGGSDTDGSYYDYGGGGGGSSHAVGSGDLLRAHRAHGSRQA